MTQDGGKKGCVLIVDDSADSCKAIAGLLGLEGHTSYECATGEDALDILNKSDDEVDACVLDQQLDGSQLSGMETLREMHRLYPAIPVLVFTGYDDLGVEAMQMGATLYIRKPVTPQSLTAMVTALVTQRKLKREIALSGNEREFLRRSIDAIHDEVMILAPDRSVLLANKRKRENSPDFPSNELGYDLEEWTKEGNGHPREVIVGSRTLLCHTEPVYDGDGKLKYYVQTSTDISKRKQAVKVIQSLWEYTAKLPSTLLDGVADSLHEMGYARVRIFLRDGEEYQGVAAKGMPFDFDIHKYILRADDPPTKSAEREGEPVLIPYEKLIDDRFHREFSKSGVKSQLQVVLTSAGKTIGVISIDDKGANTPLNHADRDILLLMAPAIADALNHALQRVDQDREVYWLHKLREIDQVLVEASDVLSVLQAVVNELRKITLADAGVVLTRRGHSDTYRVATVSEGTNKELIGIEHPGDAGLVGVCLKRTDIIIEPDIHQVPEFLAYSRTLQDGTAWKTFITGASGAVLIPVICGKTTIGVVVLRFAEDFRLSEIDEKHLSDMANRVAIALAKLDEAQRIEAAVIQQAKLSDLALLSAGVAHGIRNPLATVRASLELARRSDPAQIVRRLEVAEENLKRALVIIDRLSEWARPQGIQANPVSLREVLLELLDIIGQELEERNINCTIDSSNDVRLVNVSPAGIRMAIVDLFWNAKRAMTPNGGKLRIKLRNANDRQVELTIEDTGHGMSPEQVKELFVTNPFEPIPPGGTGLGLYLAQKIIESAGGSIGCESVVGRGTAFTILLPSE